jgi:RNA polymerase sigma-70 factor (ECF subfamily)
MPAPRLSVVATAGEKGLLVAARGGDEEAFVRLTVRHRRVLHVHCYRMLGSLDDADDALQETMLRAWRGVARFEPRGSLVGWLYRIATNVCLRMIEQRASRSTGEVERHLQPYPDRWLEELPTRDPGPAAQAQAREGVGLAFVAALQRLPAKQRAVLVLRDVLGMSARDAAELLGDSVTAVNSALQRARDRLRGQPEDDAWVRVHAPASRSVEAQLMRQFQDAWAAVDIERMVSLLDPDALLAMPPEAARFSGAAAIGEFFATVPLAGRLDRITLVSARANDQPATAAYAEEPDGQRRAYGVMVFAIRGDRIAGITGFARRPDLFTRLGLPLELGGGADE